MNTETIWTDKDRRSGRPCIRNTRFTVAQLIAEIADGKSVEKVASDFALSEEDVRDVLHRIAYYLDQDWSKGSPALRKGIEILG